MRTILTLFLRLKFDKRAAVLQCKIQIDEQRLGGFEAKLN